MKNRIFLLAAMAILSFASCSKDNNSTVITPYGVGPSYLFKGDMHDNLTVTSFNRENISISYKGVIFSGTAVGSVYGPFYYFTVSNGYQLTATGTIHLVVYPIANNYTYYTHPYIEFNPGSIFESKTYTMFTE